MAGKSRIVWRTSFAKALDRRRAAETLPIFRRQPKQSVAAKHTDAIPTGARRRHPIPRRSGRIPAMVCVVNACASVRLCRSLPSFAFHLASHVICRERASRRERDGSKQSQPGTSSRNGTSLPRAQKDPSHLAHSDGKPRVQLSSHATRAQSGLCRPIWVSLRACQLHLHWAMHT